MISDNELSELFGTHLGIYPFHEKNIEGASVFLTASKYAFSKSTKKLIVTEQKITIQPNDTAIIITAESVSLDSWISGICISRVSQTLKGLVVSSTPIKPGWTGRLLIAIVNTNKDPVTIKVGDQIAVVMFSKLKKKALLEDTRRNRSDLLSSMGMQVPAEQQDEFRNDINNQNSINPQTLMKEMKKTDDYKTFIKRKQKKINVILVLFIICSLFSVGLNAWWYFQKNNGANADYLLAIIPVFTSAAMTLAYKIWLE